MVKLYYGSIIVWVGSHELRDQAFYKSNFAYVLLKKHQKAALMLKLLFNICAFLRLGFTCKIPDHTAKTQLLAVPVHHLIRLQTRTIPFMFYTTVAPLIHVFVNHITCVFTMFLHFQVILILQLNDHERTQHAVREVLAHGRTSRGARGQHSGAQRGTNFRSRSTLQPRTRPETSSLVGKYLEVNCVK